MESKITQIFILLILMPMVKADKDIIISTTKYEIEFISSVNFKSIYGVQFHPEKSQLNGLKLLKNFNDNC